MESVESNSELRILLVEDNPDHQYILLRALASGRSRVNVCVVSSGAEFIQVIAESNFDCAVMDFNLSDYRADELIRQANTHLAGCPVIVTSCNQDQQIVIESFRSGVVDFVPKINAGSGDVLWRSVEQAVKTAQAEQLERRQRERREQDLLSKSETDPLTGLKNRRYFERCVSKGHWFGDRRRMMTCVMIDVDHFKNINDTYGHNVGDDALRAVTKCVESSLSGPDIAIRWGGEEILVLRPSHSITESWLWAEELRIKIEQVRLTHVPDLHMSASMGIARVATDHLGAESIGMADDALYLAKSTGRNRVCTYAMVQFERIIGEVLNTEQLSFHRRVAAFINKASAMLGQTQLQHMTTHCDDVSDMSRQIARVLQVNSETEELARLGGLIHDIGKCMIPEELLAKPSSLSIPERALMAKHSAFGADICARLGADELLQAVVRGHHVRHDTETDSDAINMAQLATRIVCCSDAIVTMLTDRPYQKARQVDEVLTELRRERDRQFDPQVVDAAHFVGLDVRTAA